MKVIHPTWIADDVTLWKHELLLRVHDGFMEIVKPAAERLIFVLIGRVVAGRFIAGTGGDGNESYVIELNPLQTYEQAHETFAHEFAHFLAWIIDGHSGHGPTWQFWCRQLGFKPEQFHQYDALLGK